jgi:hypothetical protein
MHRTLNNILYIFIFFSQTDQISIDGFKVYQEYRFESRILIEHTIKYKIKKAYDVIISLLY